MRELWAANLKGKMFLFGITNQAVADRTGLTKQYIGQLLSGVRKTKGAQQRLENAVDELIKEREVI